MPPGLLLYFPEFARVMTDTRNISLGIPGVQARNQAIGCEWPQALVEQRVAQFATAIGGIEPTDRFLMGNTSISRRPNRQHEEYVQ